METGKVWNIIPGIWAQSRVEYKYKQQSITKELTLRLGRKLAVYTGTSGILKYPDVNDVEQEIYLVVEDKYVPAPLYYWKVIQDKVRLNKFFIQLLA